jgi:hypothetical protein
MGSDTTPGSPCFGKEGINYTPMTEADWEKRNKTSKTSVANSDSPT